MQTLLLIVLTPIFSLFVALGRLRITGRENIPDGGFIAVANHMAHLDPFFVAIAIRRRIRFMGKSEFFTGVAGELFSRLGGFPVQRGVWDAEAFETAERILERGRVFAMFPEGGIVEGTGKGRRGIAKPGLGYLATRSGATVLPIYLDGVRDLYRWRTFPRVTVRIGAPIPGERLQDPSREEQAAVAQAAVDAVYALER